jgi:hypothetical protein
MALFPEEGSPTQQRVAIATSALFFFLAGGTRPMKSVARKKGGVEQKRTPHFEGSSRSHHVEVVLQRILAKRHQYQEQEPLRHIDLEEWPGTETELPANEGVS